MCTSININFWCVYSFQQSLLTLATLAFPLIMFQAGFYDIHPGYNKMEGD